MHEDFETELRESVARFTERAAPPSASVVRARGDRAHRRKALGTAGLAMASVAGLGITAVAATAGSGQPGTLPTTPLRTATTDAVTGATTDATTDTTTDTTTAPAPATTPQPPRTTPAPPAPTGDNTPGGGIGPVALALNSPAGYAAGTLNPVTFTVENQGPAIPGVTATFTLVRPKSEVANTTGPWPLDVIERRDPATGTWNKVTVTFLNNGVDAHGEDVRQAHYTFDLPNGTSTEQLRIDPEGSLFTLGVKLTSGSQSLAQAQADAIAVHFPTMSVTGPKVLKPGTTGEFDITLTNDTLRDYPSIAFWTDALVSTSPFTMASRLQVYDGGSWRTLSVEQSGWAVFGIRSLASGATTTVRLRVSLPADAPSGAGDLGIRAYVPGEFNSGAADPGNPPGGETRKDALFTIG